MIVTVNGNEKELKKGAKLKDALAGETHAVGSTVSIFLSSTKTKNETSDFEIVTSKGNMVIHLDDTEDAKKWKDLTDSIKGTGARWSTRKLVAFGSFVSDIKVDREQRMYRENDCFFSLGGFDNNTTYVMIAKEDHKWAYGAGPGRIGRITSGRHIIRKLTEGDVIMDVHPMVSETDSENAVVTTDMNYILDDGMVVESYVEIKLTHDSPMSSEHILVTAGKGTLDISDATGTFAACSDNTDVAFEEETHRVRDHNTVSIRYNGAGVGRIFFYRVRRPVLSAHNYAGDVVHGSRIIKQAKSGDKISVITDPKRVMSVGMTQKEGKKFLESFGIKQNRTGDTSDDAIITEQEPEWTMNAIKGGEVDTLGIKKEMIHRVSLDRKKEAKSVHFFEKVTGLSHKPIGTLKVHFTFDGLPMITFEGDEERGKSLYPGAEFKNCKKGDIGITNQARPTPGIIGIRLINSKEFGPTGEEPYGTNICGKFVSDLNVLMNGIKDGDIIYVTEEEL